MLDDEFVPAVINGIGSDDTVRVTGQILRDPSGGLHIGMAYVGLIYIDPGMGVISPPSLTTDQRSLVLKLDASGNYANHWDSGASTSSPVQLFDNTLYIAGTFSGTKDFPTGDTLTASTGDTYLLGVTLSSPSAAAGRARGSGIWR